jgi:hypothetical protein
MGPFDQPVTQTEITNDRLTMAALSNRHSRFLGATYTQIAAANIELSSVFKFVRSDSPNSHITSSHVMFSIMPQIAEGGVSGNLQMYNKRIEFTMKRYQRAFVVSLETLVSKRGQEEYTAKLAAMMAEAIQTSIVLGLTAILQSPDCYTETQAAVYTPNSPTLVEAYARYFAMTNLGRYAEPARTLNAELARLPFTPNRLIVGPGVSAMFATSAHPAVDYSKGGDLMYSDAVVPNDALIMRTPNGLRVDTVQAIATGNPYVLDHESVSPLTRRGQFGSFFGMECTDESDGLNYLSRQRDMYVSAGGTTMGSMTRVSFRDALINSGRWDPLTGALADTHYEIAADIRSARSTCGLTANNEAFSDMFIARGIGNEYIVTKIYGQMDPEAFSPDAYRHVHRTLFRALTQKMQPAYVDAIERGFKAISEINSKVLTQADIDFMATHIGSDSVAPGTQFGGPKFDVGNIDADPNGVIPPGTTQIPVGFGSPAGLWSLASLATSSAKWSAHFRGFVDIAVNFKRATDRLYNELRCVLGDDSPLLDAKYTPANFQSTASGEIAKRYNGLSTFLAALITGPTPVVYFNAAIGAGNTAIVAVYKDSARAINAFIAEVYGADFGLPSPEIREVLSTQANIHKFLDNVPTSSMAIAMKEAYAPGIADTTFASIYEWFKDSLRGSPPQVVHNTMHEFIHRLVISIKANESINDTNIDNILDMVREDGRTRVASPAPNDVLMTRFVLSPSAVAEYKKSNANSPISLGSWENPRKLVSEAAALFNMEIGSIDMTRIGYASAGNNMLFGSAQGLLCNENLKNRLREVNGCDGNVFELLAKRLTLFMSTDLNTAMRCIDNNIGVPYEPIGFRHTEVESVASVACNDDGYAAIVQMEPVMTTDQDVTARTAHVIMSLYQTAVVLQPQHGFKIEHSMFIRTLHGQSLTPFKSYDYAAECEQNTVLFTLAPFGSTEKMRDITYINGIVPNRASFISNISEREDLLHKPLYPSVLYTSYLYELHKVNFVHTALFGNGERNALFAREDTFSRGPSGAFIPVRETSDVFRIHTKNSVAIGGMSIAGVQSPY